MAGGTTFTLTNLVNFNEPSPRVYVRSYWKDENDFVEIDRSDYFPISLNTENVVLANDYVLVFRENDGTTNTFTTGSETVRYITAFI